MKKIEINIGDIFKNKNGSEFKITNTLNGNKFKIKFLNTAGFESEVSRKCILDGSVKDYYKLDVFSVACIGKGEYNSLSHHVIYNTWNGMLRRCYDKNPKYIREAYRNCSVCEEWLNFQNFAKWYEENFPYHIEGIKFQLDKDLLQHNVGNKIYSPQTCVFLPDKVNSFLSIGYTTKIKSEHVGVNWHSRYNKYYVRCRDFLSNKVLNLGYYTNKEEAVKVYNKVKNKQINNVIEYLLNLNYLNPNLVYILENRKLGDDK